MGIITSLLFAGGVISVFKIPLWVVLAAQAAIALGTMSGGWRITKTMGQKITRLTPIDGFCAETAAASSIFFATSMGVPVSTTHLITGAISGGRVGKPLVRSTLGCDAEYRRGLGAHNPGSGHYFRYSFLCN
jgi:phosphate/sulfate permease